MEQNATSKVFSFPKKGPYKKYKIYAFLNEKGEFIYIGCTNQSIKNRACGHLCTGGRKLEYLSDCFKNGSKVKIIVLFHFHSKIIAGITERILITFVKKYINPQCFNMPCRLIEESMLNENKRHTQY